MTRISVIIATHNRADLLRLALESIARQTLDPAAYEVIVVDNASSDHTAATVSQMSAQMPQLRYVSEKRLGLSFARNAGLAAARSPHVAYLDDDALAERGWMEAVMAAFGEITPHPQCVGGPVYLNWNGLPQSVPRRFWSLLSYVSHGDQNRLLTDKEYLVGANIAFDRDALLRTGGFSTDLGRKGSNLLSGEEAQVVARIRQNGGLVYYAAQAGVWHIVQPDRTRRGWLWRRIFWDGASQPVLDEKPGRNCAIEAYRDLKRIAYFSLNALLAWFRRDSERSLDFALYATQRVGRLRTHLLLLVGAAS